jgi:hypothetical protein
MCSAKGFNNVRIYNSIKRNKSQTRIAEGQGFSVSLMKSVKEETWVGGDQIEH